MPRTTDDVTVRYLENLGPNTAIDITIPAGTEVVLVRGRAGAPSAEYAVESEALLIRLTGNTHDPKYRYCYVPNNVVDPWD